MESKERTIKKHDLPPWQVPKDIMGTEKDTLGSRKRHFSEQRKKSWEDGMTPWGADNDILTAGKDTIGSRKSNRAERDTIESRKRHHGTGKWRRGKQQYAPREAVNENMGNRNIYMGKK